MKEIFIDSWNRKKLQMKNFKKENQEKSSQLIHLMQN